VSALRVGLKSAAAEGLKLGARWRWWEGALLLALLLSWGLLPTHALLLNEIAILALFAMSLDLILGYAGIVSLGHAAFFGFGAYAAALFAKLVMPDPWVGMAVAVAGGGGGGARWRPRPASARYAAC
jgi:branched-chain amino acid transport system permease protein